MSANQNSPTSDNGHAINANGHTTNGHGSNVDAVPNGNGAVVYANGPANGNLRQAKGNGYDSVLGTAGLQILPMPYYTNQPSASEHSDLDLKQFFQVIRRRAWLIGGVAVAVILSSWLSALARRPVYQGGFQVLIDNATSAEAAGELLSPRQDFDFLDYNTQLQVLRGSAILMPVYEDLQQKYPALSFGQLVGNLYLDYLKGTKVLAVSYRDSDPEIVQDVLKAVAQEYLLYSSRQQQDALQQGIQFVNDQLPRLEERVDTFQKQLEQFRQRYSLINPEIRGSELSDLLNSIQEQQQTTRVQLTEASSLFSLLQQQLGADVSAAVASASLSESEHYQSVLAQIEELETQIALESARFQPTSPQIQALVERRSNLTQLLDLEAQRVLGGNGGAGLNDRMTSIPLDLTRQLVDTTNQIQVLQVRNQALKAAENQLKQEFELIPSLSREYTDLQRELLVATKSLNRFLETRETLQIEASQQSTPWQLISEPFVSTVPISPNIPRNLSLGLVAGLLLGVGAGFLRDRFDHVFHSIEEIKDLIKFPIIGTIPHSSELEDVKAMTSSGSSANKNFPNWQSESKWRTPLEKSGRGYGYSYGTSPFQESFRLLYSNLRFLSSDGPIRSVVISSALPGDGKSTVSIYTAHAAAAMGQRVLIVDADMRRPQLHQRLDLNNMRGLSNVLASNIEPDQVIQTVDQNLSVLTAGQVPPDPTKLLSSNRMKMLIEEFQASYDLVLYDTPPLLGLADGSLLATHLDGVLLVIGLGKTNRSTVHQVLDNLKVSSVPILGIVANGLESNAYGNGYYYHYQNYYYGPSGKTREMVES